VAVTDRYWGPVEPAEAAAVLGRPVEIVSQHLRWLFAVARCRWDTGEAIVKRQPPMGRTADQLRWQHRLTNHLADRGVPAVRARELVELDGLWYEVYDVATGDDTYAGVDTWEPFFSQQHVLVAGRGLAAMHEAGRDFEPRRPQPQRGFVVQLGLAELAPAAAVELLAGERPAVAAYIRGEDWRNDITTAYDELFRRLRPVLSELPPAPLHGDWQTNNLFFDGDRLSSIIDFHQADYAPRVLDLMYPSRTRGVLSDYKIDNSVTSSRFQPSIGSWRMRPSSIWDISVPTATPTSCSTRQRSGDEARRASRVLPLAFRSGGDVSVRPHDLGVQGRRKDVRPLPARRGLASGQPQVRAPARRGAARGARGGASRIPPQQASLEHCDHRWFATRRCHPRHDRGLI
jgi:Ser/Thr protein kinase RdoA (MazF antagonist)